MGMLLASSLAGGLQGASYSYFVAPLYHVPPSPPSQFVLSRVYVAPKFHISVPSLRGQSWAFEIIYASGSYNRLSDRLLLLLELWYG